MNKSGLAILENKTEKMYENETENERLYDIVNTCKDILYLNNQNQEGQGLKPLTPDQVLSRLQTSLCQLKAGINSEELKMK